MIAVVNVGRGLGIDRCAQHRGFPPPPPPEDGVDLEHLRYNLMLTPAERLTQNDLWVGVFGRFMPDQLDCEEALAIVETLTDE